MDTPRHDDDLTTGDPLGGDAGAVERPHYGAGPVPPGAFAPRPERPPAPRQEDLADWGRRAVATIIDGVILGAITLVLLAVLGIGFFSDDSVGVVEVLVGLLGFTLLFTVLALLYAPVVMAQTNGQTLGKKLAGCRVVRADGKPVDFWWAALREVAVKGLLVGVAGSLTGGIAYLVDVLWPFVDGQKRALHDYVVDSRVVRS